MTRLGVPAATLGTLVLLATIAVVSWAADPPPSQRTVDVAFNGTATFDGVARADATASGIMMEGATAQTAYRLAGQNLTYHLVNVPRIVLTYAGNSLEYNEEPELVRAGTFTGELALVSGLEGLSVRVLPAHEGRAIHFTLENASRLEIGPARDAGAWATPDAIQGAGRVVGHDVRPARGAGVLTIPSTADARVSGDLFAVHWQGTFALAGAQTAVTGSWRNESRSLEDPAGTFSREVHDQVCLLVDARAADAWMQPAGAGLAAFPDRLVVEGATRLAFSGAEGRLKGDGPSLPFAGGLLVLEGLSRTETALEPDGRRAEVSGAFTSIRLDGRAVGEPRGDLIPPAATAVLGFLGLLSLAGLLASDLGQRLLAALLWNSTTPMGNPVRCRILDLVRENPGISQSDLAKRLGRADRRFARYHLHVLRKNHLIEAVAFGNKWSFMSNGGTFGGSVRAADGRLIEVRQAVASLSHARRRAIFTLLGQGGPCSYAEIRSRWSSQVPGAPCPNQANFTFHTRQMEHVGLLVREARGRTVLWRVEHQLAARIAAAGLLPPGAAATS